MNERTSRTSRDRLDHSEKPLWIRWPTGVAAFMSAVVWGLWNWLACFVHGHDWHVVFWAFGNEPKPHRAICQRCGRDRNPVSRNWPVDAEKRARETGSGEVVDFAE